MEQTNDPNSSKLGLTSSGTQATVNSHSANDPFTQTTDVDSGTFFFELRFTRAGSAEVQIIQSSGPMTDFWPLSSHVGQPLSQKIDFCPTRLGSNCILRRIMAENINSCTLEPGSDLLSVWVGELPVQASERVREEEGGAEGK